MASSTSSASTAAPTGRLCAVNLGTVRRLPVAGRTVMSAYGKRAVAGPIAVGPLGLAGDEQADLTVHGGLAKALYAYPAEHYPFWEQARRDAGVTAEADAGLLAAALPSGALGENLTLEGLRESEVWVGDRLLLPDCELVVSEPRQPCYKFVAVMGFARAAKAMAESGFCGFYLRVARPGTLEAGQAFTLQPGPREVRIDQAFRLKMARRDV
ncbi:MOSC domain-containing protein [Sphaerotilus microaerophilus]|uniref:Molybdenum cofactor biosynthesis protein n=1 Tax=Sphaerotilus microaerophilus TaxID=2914710 RepID=A0ABN6PSY5_9BURK|nr:MOSC domain-containing protein [Sphaerotilus sp. FB-5]BDI07188.1 molybdenum cofactor biosynthesis protein [Sphaerotilus sp. FB-5]